MIAFRDKVPKRIGALFSKEASWGARLAVLFIISSVISVFSGILLFYRNDIYHFDADEVEYWNLSSDLLNFEFNVAGRRTLGFPFILAIIRLCFPSLVLIQIAITLLACTASPLLAHAVYRVSGDRRAGILAGTVIAFWPPQIFLATSLYSETVALPLFLAALCMFPARSQPPKWTNFLSMGILMAALCHVRTMYQLFIPFIVLIILYQYRIRWKSVLFIGCVLLGFLAAVLPWSIYISQRTDHRMLLTANGGETLAGGLNPVILTDHPSLQLDKRTSWVGPGKWITPDQTGYLTEQDFKKSYVERDKILFTGAVTWIKEHPGSAIYLTARKIAYMWGIYPFARNGLKVAIFGNIPIILLTILFLAVLSLHPQIRRDAMRFNLVPLFVTGVAVISWGSWRFRQPADAAMIAVVAWGLSALIAHRFAAKGKERRHAS